MQSGFFFFFSIFYDALILFTARFFIVVSAPEEVGLWKMRIYMCVCVFMVSIAFRSDPAEHEKIGVLLFCFFV